MPKQATIRQGGETRYMQPLCHESPLHNQPFRDEYANDGEKADMKEKVKTTMMETHETKLMAKV